MPHFDPRQPASLQSDARPLQRALSALAWLGFGVVLLAFLVAIERQTWFHLKPATGSARAMSFASEKPGATGIGASRS